MIAGTNQGHEKFGHQVAIGDAVDPIPVQVNVLPGDAVA